MPPPTTERWKKIIPFKRAAKENTINLIVPVATLTGWT